LGRFGKKSARIRLRARIFPESGHFLIAPTENAEHKNALLQIGAKQYQETQE
jgi:hypothetical protein